ncbi:hypothetical protein K7X08_012436 [Anisodus acutangulus]|uniref:Uncharacterized protein n=1 Tax=Anisodus acutangulus TaxID=402998 RepID=A0A9Q1LA83_9SOLA|nr:hypothetical protein K7X08_012436 [Anisodus acutangulus]
MDTSSVQSTPSIQDDVWDIEGYVIPSLELEDPGQNNSNIVEVEESKSSSAESKKEENIYLGPHGAPPSQEGSRHEVQRKWSRE